MFAFLASVVIHGVVLGWPMLSGRHEVRRAVEVRLVDETRKARAPVEMPPPGKRPLLKVVTAARRSKETKVVGDDSVRSDLHYQTFYDDNPKHPMRCMVGHVAESSGDHESALYIFSDCAKNGDNFSAISLAHYYELGLGGARKDAAKAAALFYRVATSEREAYRANGMLYYGLCLYFGFGVAEDRKAGREWLRRAAADGDHDAASFLALEATGMTPSSEHYFKR